MIIPLGLLSAPQHILPTGHIFYKLKGQIRDEGVSPTSNPPAVADVRAPGNVRILEIDYTSASDGGEFSYADYDLLFASCRDRIYKLIHLTTLNEQLARLFEATEASKCDEYPKGDRTYRYCISTVEMDVPVGTVLGSTGGSVIAALDLEAYDLSTPPLAYANPDRYRSDADRRLHIVCPLDGFTPEAREEQLVKVQGYQDHVGTAHPVCGVVMQDLPDTAQGNWFTGQEPGGQPDFSQRLALVHHHVDRESAAISIGGTIMEMGVWLFRARNDGLVNREFGQVVPDGEVYCYQGAVLSEGGKEPSVFPGRLLISLTSETEMWVERQDGECSGEPAFVDPHVYRR